MNILFLFRTAKKKNYFGLLRDNALSDVNVEVCAYHRLPRSTASSVFPLSLNPSPVVLNNLTAKAERQLFESRESRWVTPLKLMLRPLLKYLIQILYRRIHTRLSTNPPDIIVIWNGLKLHDHVLHAVNSRHMIPVAFMENGLLPKTTTLDKKGINAYNSVPRCWKTFTDFEEAGIQAGVELDSIPQCSERSCEQSKKTLIYENRTRKRKTAVSNLTKVSTPGVRTSLSFPFRLSGFFMNPANERSNPDFISCQGLAPVSKPDIHELMDQNANYILIPFQLDRDSQILEYSPWVPNMRALFTHCVNAMESLNYEVFDGDCAPPHSRTYLVFRPHPSSRTRYRDLYEQSQRYPNVVFDLSNDIGAVIKSARAVLTINSTVGLHALLSAKPLIVLGEAFYSVDGLALRAGNPAELKRCLTSLKSFFPNPCYLARFHHYLANRYVIPGSWQAPGEQHYLAVRKKLLCAEPEKYTETSATAATQRGESTQPHMVWQFRTGLES